MQVPSILQGDSLTRLIQGMAVGAIATVAIGFYWGGWVTGGTAERQAQQRAETTLVKILAPMCAENFRQQPNFAEKLAELKKVGSWQRDDFVTKGGWVQASGTRSTDNAVAGACAELLLKLAT